MKRAVKILLSVLLWLVVGVGLAVAIVPSFLDRIYYRGGETAHFDAKRFFNPDGDDDTLRVPNGNRTNFFVRYLTGSDGRPPWPDHIAITPGHPPAHVDGSKMAVTWIGHATVLIQTQGLNILTDPVWSRTAGPFGLGPARVAEPGVRLADLPKIDLILVSHDHYDHMDLPTLKALWTRDRPPIVTSLGNDAVIGTAGVPAKALDWGQSIPVKPGVSVVVTRNHHWGSRWFADRDRALWSSFVVRLPGGNVFFAGDTGMGDGKWPDEAAKLGPIRFAAIPIGAFRFTPGGMGIGSHIGPVDAVEVYRKLGAAWAIGIHWGTFRLSYEAYDTPPRLLKAAEACTGQSGYVTIPIGKPLWVPEWRARPNNGMDRAGLLKCLDIPAVRALR